MIFDFMYVRKSRECTFDAIYVSVDIWKNSIIGWQKLCVNTKKLCKLNILQIEIKQPVVVSLYG